jgi:hypothetical protein
VSAILLPIQTFAGEGEMAMDGCGKITILIESLGLSHPATVRVTKRFVVPAVVVEGVGAEDEPLPPDDTVYQRRPLPVALRGAAVVFWQY